MRRAGAVVVTAAVASLLGASAAPAATFSGLEPVRPQVRLNAAACGATRCLVVGDHGQAATAADPTPGGGAAQWRAFDLDGSQQLTGAACPADEQCLATDAHGVLTSLAPGTAGSWHRVTVDPAHHLNAISCPTSSLCVAVDRAGGILTSRHPGGSRSAWHRTQLGRRDVNLQSVSCASVSLCAAADLNDYVLVSTRPTAGASAWHRVPIAGCQSGLCGQITRVTCFRPGGCAAIELNFSDLSIDISSRPGVARSWRAPYGASYAHAGEPYGSVACGSSRRCIEADGGTMGDAEANLFTDGAFRHAAATLHFGSFDGTGGTPPGTVRAAACGTAAAAPCVLADSAGNVIVAR